MRGPRAEARSLLAVLVPLVTVALAGTACAGGASAPPAAASFPAMETAVPAATAAPLPFAAPPIVPRETAIRPTMTRATTASRSPTSTPRRSTSARRAAGGAGCGRRATASGRFDPSCAEYQGYLDPGVAGGRAPSSGDIQREDACDEGLLPASDC